MGSVELRNTLYFHRNNSIVTVISIILYYTKVSYSVRMAIASIRCPYGKSLNIGIKHSMA